MSTIKLSSTSTDNFARPCMIGNDVAIQIPEGATVLEKSELAAIAQVTEGDISDAIAAWRSDNPGRYETILSADIE